MGRLYGFQRKPALRPAVAETKLTIGLGGLDVTHEIERCVIALTGRMRLARGFAPDGRIDYGKGSIPLRLHVDAGDLQPVGERHRPGIDLCTADYHDIRTAPQRVAAGGIDRHLVRL